MILSERYLEFLMAHAPDVLAETDDVTRAAEHLCDHTKVYVADEGAAAALDRLLVRYGYGEVRDEVRRVLERLEADYADTEDAD